MCLAIPARIVTIDLTRNEAVIDSLGVTRRAALDLIDTPISEGDYVLIHIGFVIRKIDRELAEASIEMHRRYAEETYGGTDGSGS
jgi:hydrogenase expression/formation protein HypC